MGFPGGSDGKESTCNVENLGLIPGLGRSPEERNGYPFQYSCMQNSMDRGACQATVHRVAKSQTWLLLTPPFLQSSSQNHDHWEDHSLDNMDLCQQRMPLLFNTLSRFVIAFLQRSKLLVSWLQSLSAVILEPKKNSVATSTFTHYLSWSNGVRCYDLRFFLFVCF